MEKVLVRTYSAGVWAGEMVRRYGKEVELRGARRLWYWVCHKGISLSSVALYGITAESKVPAAVPLVLLTEAIEIIPLSAEAVASIEAQPEYLP